SEGPVPEAGTPFASLAAEASGEVHEVRTDTGVTCAAKTLRLPLQLGDELPSSCREREKPVPDCGIANIVRFLHIIAQPEPAAVVVFMELLDGRTLERFIDNTSRWTSQRFETSASRHSELHGARAARSGRVGQRAVQQRVGHLGVRLLASSQMASGARPFANARSFLEMAQLIDRKGAPPLRTAGPQEEKIRAQELLGHEFLTDYIREGQEAMHKDRWQLLYQVADKQSLYMQAAGSALNLSFAIVLWALRLALVWSCLDSWGRGE
uniref:Protein kinase domain-containing protein n=1 Tax=Macrostomum lignano TaxID=282301 RepID=A0A1I8FRW2_9PLAT